MERTRSAVLNVMLVAGVGIALSGLMLGRRDRGLTDWPPAAARPWAYGALLVVVVASHLVRRLGASRSALRDPATRATRFIRAHVAAAVVALLAVPLGFAYGLAVEPELPAVLPFWVAALALGFLALPRDVELEGFDAPMANDPGGPIP
ncbi:MAG: hypothetical protein IRY99_20510 [Isosphaeraceae bacterium]|nr:hypothetical protein [Isosphaeraceae bacterium]